MDRWANVKAAERDAESEFRKACEREEIAGGVDEEDIGEPYMQWLSKDLARQKREQQKS